MAGLSEGVRKECLEMTARLMFVTATTLILATGAVAADPVKPDLHEAGAVQPPREIVLASAETRSPAPTADTPASAPVKRRVARVTTCRCGDPQPTETQAD